MSTIQQFTADFTKWQDQVKERMQLLVQGTGITVFNEIQSGGKYSPGTPIDTGFARANWDASVGEAANRGTAGGDETPDPGAAAERAQLSILEWKPGAGVIRLSNAAAYILPLEFGHSRQAPQGMIRQAVAAAQQIVDEVAEHIVASHAQ